MSFDCWAGMALRLLIEAVSREVTVGSTIDKACQRGETYSQLHCARATGRAVNQRFTGDSFIERFVVAWQRLVGDSVPCFTAEQFAAERQFVAAARRLAKSPNLRRR